MRAYGPKAIYMSLVGSLQGVNVTDRDDFYMFYVGRVAEEDFATSL